MADLRRTQLEWVQRNRAPRSRAVAAGQAVTDFAKHLWATDIGPAEAAADALSELVDETFRRHCRVAAFNRNVLTVHVEQAALVDVMRRNWSTKIRRELPALLSRGISRVVFQHGSAGAIIGDPYLPD